MYVLAELPVAAADFAGLSDFAAWSALMIGLVGVLPRLLAVIGRRRLGEDRTELARFQAILDAQRQLVSDCRAECDRLAKELGQEKSDRIREREYFHQQIAEANRRVWELERQLYHGPSATERKRDGA